MGRLLVVSGDKDGDSRQISIPGEDAATDGTDYAALRTAAAALLAAIQAVQKQGDASLAPTLYWAITSEDTELEPSFDTFQNSAQVNTKWQMEYILNGVTAEKKHIPIPVANLDVTGASVVGGRVQLNLASGVGAALKTAFEAWLTDATLEAVFHDERG